MKTLNEYLAMPYRMEIVEDREVYLLAKNDALHAG